MEKFPIPDVLECMHFVLSTSQRNSRIVRNYEFDLYLGGEREIYINGAHYHISEGCLVFRKPGETVVGYGSYDMYMLTLDFSGSKINNLINYYRKSDSPQQPICPLDVLNQIPSVFVPYHQNDLKKIYEKLSLCSPPNIVNRELQKAYIAEFLFLVLADAYKERAGLEQSDKISYVNKACNYINRYYSEPLTVEGISNYLSLNKNYLIRLFKEELQTTPHQYLTETRLLHARYLLIHSDYSIQQVALLCGFHTPSYFIKEFKERFGKTPRNYRQAMLNENANKSTGFEAQKI